MAFEPKAWKNYCPECGEQRVLKMSGGAFSCAKCGCEFRHNWQAWMFAGVPFCVVFVALLLDLTAVVSLPRALFISLIIVSMIANRLTADHLYRVVKHGICPDENDAA